jgi:hypothetical protein
MEREAVSYQGELVAVATPTRVYLAPEVSARPPGDPRLRFVAALCLYGRDIESGELPGPYDEAEAELYARTLLIPDEEFDRYRHECDEELAERLRMPVEQIAAKRRDGR